MLIGSKKHIPTYLRIYPLTYRTYVLNEKGKKKAMPVTEIALLRLQSCKPLLSLSSNSPSLAANLRKAKDAQEAYSHHPVHFFAQVEDPSYIYLLGG